MTEPDYYRMGMNPDPTPFVRLPSRRSITVDWLPPDLRRFYADFEGVGRDSPPDRPVRLCRLDELCVVTLHDLHLFDDFPLAGGWDEFEAIRIGIGIFFDEIVYVRRAPVCPAGSIMAFGIDVDGPGGVGTAHDPEGSLVLGADFGEWLERLRIDGWDENGLVCDADELPAERITQLRKRFAELNPRSRSGRE